MLGFPLVKLFTNHVSTDVSDFRHTTCSLNEMRKTSLGFKMPYF